LRIARNGLPHRISFETERGNRCRH
jgi:hypothetical protein